MKSRSIRKRVLVPILLIVLLLAVGLVYVFKIRAQVMIPANLQTDIPFAAVYPTSKSGMTVSTDNAQYYPSERMMVFEGEYLAAHSRLVFSQQAMPDELRDDQAFKDMVEAMVPYGSFNSRFGQVSLTRPPSQGERQSAVLKTDSSLVFILAVENLTEEQWRVLIDSLALVDGARG